MSMLDRYRKPGGFIQLLNLLETSGKEKQEKFLTLIRQEDPNWAVALEQKMLTIKKIFSWEIEVISEITGNVQDITLAVALQGLEEDAKQKVLATLGHAHKRKIDAILDSHNPNPVEISSMFMKILTEVRKMITEGKLRMDKIDPSLVIEGEIEAKLQKGELSLSSANSGVVPLTGDNEIVTEEGTTLKFNIPSAKEEIVDEPPSATAATGPSAQEVVQLRKKLTATQAENTSLKQEVAKLKTKLDQIRKLSA